MTNITEQTLTELRSEVQKRQNEKRFLHTCGVETEVAYLGSIYLPELVGELRAAALLHDLTKCTPDDEQVALCEHLGIPLSEEQKKVPATLHGISAEAIIKRDFPLFATPRILRAVRLHTTGSDHMSTFDKIVYLSDYIEAGRPYPDCKRMREKFHSRLESGQCDIMHLDEILREVFLLTLQFFKRKNILTDPATMQAYLALGGNINEV